MSTALEQHIEKHDGFVVIDKREAARESKRAEAQKRKDGQASWTKQAAATMFWEANNQALKGHTVNAEQIMAKRGELLDGAAKAGVALPAGIT